MSHDMTVGRIEFESVANWVVNRPPAGSRYPHVPPGYTVESPKRPTPSKVALTTPLTSYWWLIEVCFDGDSRAPRYFTGECEAGWVGCTTIRADLAQKYSSKEAAENDISKLAPRLIGKWVAREHGFS